MLRSLEAAQAAGLLGYTPEDAAFSRRCHALFGPLGLPDDAPRGPTPAQLAWRDEPQPGGSGAGAGGALGGGAPAPKAWADLLV